MIGKIIIGKSFRGCISYLLEDKLSPDGKRATENRAEILDYNQCFGNKKELIRQFNDVRFLNPKLAKPVMHISLSLTPGEKLEKPGLITLAEECARDLGFEKNQFLAVTHNDTSHQHIHIVVNRVGFDGRTWNDSNNYKKIAAFCRKMELKYSLRQVASPAKFLPKERQNNIRFDTRKETMKSAIEYSLIESKTYADFERKMTQQGFKITKARGIAFTDPKKVYAKGSELGYSLATIERILALQLEQKQAMIHNRMQARKAPLLVEKSNLLEALANRGIINDQALATARALELLLKPENYDDFVPHELLHKKRKGKTPS